MLFVLGTLETPNFRFEAVGTSEAEVHSLLEASWSSHFDERGQPADMLSFDAVMDESERPGARYFLSFRELEVGAAYRDGCQLKVVQTA